MSLYPQLKHLQLNILAIDPGLNNIGFSHLLYSHPNSSISSITAHTFKPELEEDISVAFQLLYAFELPDPEIDFLNLITSDSYLDSNDMQDQFTLILQSKLDYLLSQHKLTLTDTSSLYIKTQILAACYALMYLEDYTHILITLESDLTDLEKLPPIIYV